jgi:RND family efflux transporter MFP subunit
MSEGVVMTRRESVLSSQVGGRIVEVHPQFEVGATFQVGTVIAKIDRLDYETAVAQAKSVLADAELAVVQEKARGEQAARDWKKIGGGKEPSDLVLRVPFLKSAEARVLAAEAALEKAIEDLDRTVIRAPFDCRVRQVALNLGATVAPGSQLGMIYDAGNLMVRLPYSLDDYAQIPEEAEIRLFTEIGGERYEWRAEVMWDLGEVDQATVSAYLLVKILANEDGGARFRLPSTGQFLKAQLSGAVLPEVVAVPRIAVRGRDQVGVLNAENELEIRELKIVRSNEEFVYVGEGVEDGEKVILTKLQMPVEGMKLAEAQQEDLEKN